MRSSEVRGFAESVRSIVADHPTPAGWTPGAVGDDAVAGLSDGLRRAGWYDLVDEPGGLAFMTAAAVELGRGLTALSELDALLGGSPCLDGLARYAGAGDPAVLPVPGGARRTRIMAAEPVPYGDSIGAHRVRLPDGPDPADHGSGAVTGAVTEPADPVEGGQPVGWRREAAWLAANTGYLAGLAAEALRIALDHTRHRRAFGTTLAGLEGVQRRLADAALDSEGLLLLAFEPDGAPERDGAEAVEAGMDALAFAGPASCAVLAQCHQVVGAIGFTLEFPLHRFSRRARTVALWSDAWIAARTLPARSQVFT